MKKVCPVGSVPWHQFEAGYAPAHTHTHTHAHTHTHIHTHAHTRHKHIYVYTWDTNDGWPADKSQDYGA